MKTIMSCCVLAALVLIAGCKSELKTDLPTAPSGLVRPHPANFTPPDGVDAKACHDPRCHATIPSPHPAGYIVLSSPDFHGKDLAAHGFDIQRCQTCHATDLTGGFTGRSCSGSGCHVQADGGPTACYTCHGDFVTKKPYPQTPEFHTTHLEGGDDAALVLPCSGCHTVPAAWNSPGHFSGPPYRAVVNITDSLAFTKTKGTTGTPTYNPATNQCENVYCHGNFTNGNHFTPQWNASEQDKCGTCHGDPTTGNPLPKGASHPQVNDCSLCHTGVVDANHNIIDKSKHMNGKLDAFGSQRTDW